MNYDSITNKLNLLAYISTLKPIDSIFSISELINGNESGNGSGYGSGNGNGNGYGNGYGNGNGNGYGDG